MARKPNDGKRTEGAAPARDVRRRAAIAALVSTVLLFALLLGGAWLGGVVYEALPVGPFPKSRIVSSGVTILVLLAGYIAYTRVFARMTARRGAGNGGAGDRTGTAARGGPKGGPDRKVSRGGGGSGRGGKARGGRGRRAG